MDTKKRKLYFSVFAFGFSAMAIQILLMRELMVVFYGNELSAGIMLASWLFWVSTGSLSARFKKFEEEIFHILLLSISVLAPATVFFIRDLKNILGTSTGELIGLAPMALSSFILLAPICLVFGALFSMSCSLASREPETSHDTAGKVYMIESLGAVTGGLAFNFLLVYILSPLQIALFCGLLNIGTVTVMADRRKAPVRWGATFIFMCYIAVYILTGAGLDDFRMRQMQWKGLELVAVRDSKYGNIALTRLGSQLNLFENGLLTAATKDLLTAEESVHYALLEHPAPKRVLLVGGALNGALEEALKQPLTSVDCVELDPESVETAKERFGQTLLSGLSDPRVKMHYTDARLFIKARSRTNGDKYDVIILTLPNPYTAQINRFYSFEFYGEVKRILDERGVFSFGVASSEDYISADQARFLKCLTLTLSKRFADIKILPGENNYFLASPAAGVLTYDYKVLAERAKDRGLALKYVNVHYMPDKFSPMRVEYLEKAVKDASGAKVNFDFRPIGYFYDMALWSTRVNSGFRDILWKLYSFNWGYMIIAIVFALIGLTMLRGRPGMPEKMPYFVSIGITGFSTMLLQVVVIIAFQSIYGYVYYKIGLIFASFMAGLSGGSLAALRRIKKNVRPERKYFNLQAALCGCCLLLPVVLKLEFVSGILFLLFSAGAGFIGGSQFVLANRICSDKGSFAPLLYAIDLAGACAGSLLTAAILLPVRGVDFTCIAVGVINLAVLVLLADPDQLFRSNT